MSPVSEMIGALSKSVSRKPSRGEFVDLEQGDIPQATSSPVISERAYLSEHNEPCLPSFPTAPTSIKPSVLRSPLPRLDDMDVSSPIGPYSLPSSPDSVGMLSAQQPYIHHSDIGTKFPTLSYGEGIPRRVFVDPTFEPTVLRSESSPTPALEEPQRDNEMTWSPYSSGAGILAENANNFDIFGLGGEASTTDHHYHRDSSLTVPSFRAMSDDGQDTGSGAAEEPSEHAEEEASEEGTDGRQRHASVKNRPPTPPLLFGKGTLAGPSLVRKNSRLVVAAQNAGIREDSRLGRAMGADTDQDWVTETEVHTNAKGQGAGHPYVETGSSFADNSDSGGLSNLPPNQTSIGNQSFEPLHHPPHPRYPYSWMMQNDVHTGASVFVPNYTSPEHQLTDINTGMTRRVLTNQGNTYQHPVPLPAGHPHPMTMSLVVPHASSSDQQDETSSLSREYIEMTHLSYVPVEREDVRDAHASANVQSGELNQVQHSRQSSVWMSTVDGDQSREISLPTQLDSFARIQVMQGRGNLIGTPDGTGAREAGSSLAGESSSGVKFSSSSNMNHSSSPAQFTSSTPSRHRILRRFNRFTLDSRSTTPEKTSQVHTNDRSHSLPSQRSEHEDLSQDGSMERQLGTDPAEGDVGLMPLPLNVSPSPQHLRGPMTLPASQENNRTPAPRHPRWGAANKASAEPLLQKSSLTPTVTQSEDARSSWSNEYQEFLPPRNAHPVQRYRFSNEYSENRSSLEIPLESAAGPSNAPGHVMCPSTEIFSRKSNRGMSLGGIRHDLEEDITEQYSFEPPRGRARASAASRAYVKDGVVHTDIPRPNHPLCGRIHPLEQRPNPSTPRSSARRAPPIARLRSPRLHRLPLRSAEETLRRHKRLSRFFLILACLVPPFGLLYGHGYADKLFRYYTKGEFDGFRKKHKAVALFFTYLLMLGLVAGYVPIAMVVGH